MTLRAWLPALILSLIPHVAFAHAILAVSEPTDGAALGTAPTEIVLTFTEPVSPLTFRLLRPNGEVTRLDGARAEGERVTIPLPDGPTEGTTIVSWRVASGDTHPVGGTLTFTVGGATEVKDDLQWETYRVPSWAMATALSILTFVAIGAVVFRHWIHAAPGRRDMTVATAASVAGLVCLLANTYVHAIDVTGLGPGEIAAADAWRAVTTGSFGIATALNWVALLFALLASLRVGASGSGRAASGLAAAAAIGAYIFSGHAGTAPPELLMRPAIAIHAAAVILWVGSLFPLLNALRTGDGKTALQRFSTPIFLGSISLIVTGAIMATVQLGAIAELWSSGYGVVLLAKLAVVTPMFALGAVNRFVLTPATEAGEGRARRRLQVSIGVEILLAVVAIGVVGLWRFTPPPRSMEAVTVTVNGLQFHAHGVVAMANLELSPARVGPTKVTVSVLNVDSTPLAAEGVTVVLYDPLLQLEPMRYEATRLTDFTWIVDKAKLPMPGRWTVRVDILLGDFDKPSVKSIVNIR